KDLPSELKLNLTGLDTSATNVGKYSMVTASFGIADGYLESNYIIPVRGEEECGFTVWETEWEIIPLNVSLNWNYKKVEGQNPFNVYVLADKRLEGKVDYEYYETDRNGNIISNTPLSVDDIALAFSTTDAKYYRAKPILQTIYEGNYVFPDVEEDKMYSNPFKVGGESTAITVTLTTKEYEYTGKEVVLKWATGTPTGSLKFTYYAGDAFGVDKLNSAPKEVGTYWVEVQSTNSSLVLGGETQIQFKITKSIVPTQWKTNAKPPVLSITKSAQIKEGVTYEYFDAEMHKVEYSALSAGGTFYIRAVIKDTKNFIFDDDTVETQTVEFTVAEGEELKNPSDISNPNYSLEDDDREKIPL
ncbi:MAG: hypothetical protein K2I23_06685, partial [Clostridia bacterium]|nr:hypothetical protein [Clostridia bacterium]